ncbi:MAG: IS1182 family transposase [Lactimicrobium sp.]|uniref:IS1182 family transposase n=2 Tax=Lactimicrobium sp. TaxID=2563780 RepID=UPI002F35EE4E
MIDMPQLDVGPYNGLYDILIAADNFWRQLNDNIDFSFVANEVRKNYSECMGRIAADPVLLFKYLLLKTARKLSDRDLIERVRYDMEMKYFLGYSPEQTEFIDPSLLTKFRRTRLKDTDLLDVLIGETVELGKKKGVIHDHEKIIVDSTHTNALYQHISAREELIRRAKELRKSVYAADESMKDKMPKKRESSGLLEDEIEYCRELLDLITSDERFKSIPDIQERLNYLKEGVDDTNEQLEYSKDQDAKIGHKTADTSFFGYKTHIAMTTDRVIVSATVTTGEKHDGKQAVNLIEKAEAAGVKADALIGDGAYSEKDNIDYTTEKGIRLASKLSENVLHGSRKKEFEFNKDAGMYVCPAGHMAIRKCKSGQEKAADGSNTRVILYFFDIEKCKTCPLREGCYKKGAKSKTYSVKIKSDTHIAQMDYMNTDEFRKLYAERYKIEAKNAELKQTLDYGEAHACGMIGMTIQAAVSIFLVNLKRIKTLENSSKDTNGKE